MSADTATVDVVADRFGINGLLSTLVASGTVYTVVDLFGGPDSHFVEFPFFTGRLVVQRNFNWFIFFITVSSFPAQREKEGKGE